MYATVDVKIQTVEIEESHNEEQIIIRLVESREGYEGVGVTLFLSSVTDAERLFVALGNYIASVKLEESVTLPG